MSLCGGPRRGEGRGTHQIVRDDTPPDPAVHAVVPMVATASQSMPTCEHTDASFTADTPALASTEPALMLIRAARGRFRAAPRQDHASHATINRGLFMLRRAEAAIAGRAIRRAPEDRLVPVQ